nr:MAG TPA: Protein of unknown function (DUF1244) [Caudoviricetes sp.]DAS02814.1 MAG TPA: Protein of unknown function (DUF1244) [Caudoviricetes sp.]
MCGRRWCSWLVKRLSGWMLQKLLMRWCRACLARWLARARMGRSA